MLKSKYVVTDSLGYLVYIYLSIYKKAYFEFLYKCIHNNIILLTRNLLGIFSDNL